MSESTRYPAITVWQPWATLIMAEAKPLEFRHWAAPRRLWGKRIAIHAAARAMRQIELQELEVKLRGDNWRSTGLNRCAALDVIEKARRSPHEFPRSAVLCLATLGERALPGWPRGLREDLAAAYLGVSLSTFRTIEGTGAYQATWLTRGRKVYLREQLDAFLDRKAGHSEPADPEAEWGAECMRALEEDGRGGAPLPLQQPG